MPMIAISKIFVIVGVLVTKLYAWDSYPIENFPPLWDWLAKNLSDESFRISQVAFEEVLKPSPACLIKSSGTVFR